MQASDFAECVNQTRLAFFSTRDSSCSVWKVAAVGPNLWFSNASLRRREL